MNPLPDVVGDEERLGQVLTNLLSNAIKYSSNAEEVKLEAKYEGGQILISVQDFGIGMSPGTLEKLFARFFLSRPGFGIVYFNGDYEAAWRNH